MSNLIKLASWKDGATSADRSTLNVVFVHGLNGHAYNTWRSGMNDASADPTFWPLWLAQDLADIAVFTLSYEAPISNWIGTSMPFQRRAANVLQRLLLETSLQTKPTIFIAHSLGGLLIKQIMLDLANRKDASSGALLDHVRGIIFMGTPHTGSGKATLLEKLSFLAWPSDMTLALKLDDPVLEKLNNDYRNWAKRRATGLSHLAFYETQHTPAGIIVAPGASDPVLDGVTATPLDKNHTNISKPVDRSALEYLLIKDFIGRGASQSPPPDPRAELEVNFGNSVPPEHRLVKEPLPPIAKSQPVFAFPKIVRVATILAIGASVYFLFRPVPPPGREPWDKTIPSKLTFGLTRTDFVKSVLGEPNQSALFNSVFDRDGCRISIIHTSKEPAQVVSGTVQGDTVLATIISHDLNSSDCKATIRPPFELIVKGSAIGSPDKTLKEATFQDFGALQSLDTTDDPLKHSFHCEPLLAYVGDYIMSQGALRLRKSAGDILGLTCRIHQNWGPLGQYDMQIWRRAPDPPAKDDKLAVLVGQLRQNYLVTNGCYTDCKPTDFQRTQYYTDLTLNDVLQALAPARVEGVGFFPADPIAGRMVNAALCPSSECGIYLNLPAPQPPGPPIEAPKSLPQKKSR
ncbi:hypothetical protein IVB16_33190 [Bradyrhizobium sp. 183]|uniref:esterase/lipase family protein n=1 Tax=unclassified Bradyrhizobium TaxID=2631580 RepID=UPI001FFF062A|nr:MULTISPECIES: hypothetical protein [unclassified Bradyrhizobium]UPJ79488.1 hypothetical protein IVB17_33185 [Bradyrhizobium sp. 184]UPJ87284.1 hypothetical protein IVB16_33190 [Bradyrhizobium sp. 183]